jgi:hypothetical protein
METGCPGGGRVLKWTLVLGPGSSDLEDPVHQRSMLDDDPGVGEDVDQGRAAGGKRALQRLAQVLGPLHQLDVASQGFHNLVVAGAEMRPRAAGLPAVAPAASELRRQGDGDQPDGYERGNSGGRRDREDEQREDAKRHQHHHRDAEQEKDPALTRAQGRTILLTLLGSSISLDCNWTDHEKQESEGEWAVPGSIDLRSGPVPSRPRSEPCPRPCAVGRERTRARSWSPLPRAR